MNDIVIINTPLHPSQEGNVGIHFSEFIQQNYYKLANRHCEPKGWSEAICFLFKTGHKISRLLHSCTQANLKVRNDVSFLRLYRNGLLAFILLLITISTHATIITVKQDGTGNFETIQEAIDASVHGDTVLVYPGIYYENIIFNAKKITVASLYLTTQNNDYIHNTIIDGNQNGSCVSIMQGEDENTVLCGFTIQNGSGYVYHKRGGGIYIIDADPQIINCYITNNTAWYGGGIYFALTNTYLSGNHITYNHAMYGGGGIILVQDANIEFDSINKNNIYVNHSSFGADIKKGGLSPALNVIVDTFTIFNPDYHFSASNDNMGFPVNDISFDIKHAKIDPLDANLYVSPYGDDANTGLTPDEPLKTIWYAYKKIYPDSINPNSIYLLPGTYSNSINGELFPISTRSYVSLIGDSNSNNILNAELNTYHIWSNNLTKDFSCSNLSLINGYELDQLQIGSVFLNFNENVLFQNIDITGCTGGGSVFASLHSDSTQIFNSKISNNLGGGISIGNSLSPPKWFLIENCIVENVGPSFSTNMLEGGLGIGVGGTFPPNIDIYVGKIINTQINNNRLKFDPLWGNGFCSALSVTRQVNVDLLNATIGNNVVEDDYAGAAVRLDEGSELNIYNSIFYGDSLYELTLGSSSGSDFPATVNISYSDLEGGEPEIQNWYNQHIINWLDGNINANPQWIETGNSAYQLQWSSPCIDAGVPMYEPGMDYPYIKIEDEKIVLYKIDGDTLHIPSTDLAGNPRIVNGRIDMGAYEYQDTGTMIKNLYLQNLQESKIYVYPNPFYVHTFITFKLEEKAEVQVIIYDLAGHQTKKLMDARLSTGEYTMTWDGKNDWGENVAEGTYVVAFVINNRKAASTKIIKKQKSTLY